MAPAALAIKTSAVSSYAQLRLKVRAALLEGQYKIEAQKLQTYWHTGKHLHEHLFLHEDRSDYGKNVIERLANDLEISETLLYQCLQGYRAFKNLYARTNSQFVPPSWAHLRAAMRVPDAKKRLALLEKASAEEWTSRELEIEVRNHRWAERISDSGGKKPASLPSVKLGPFHTYQVIRPETVHEGERGLLLDCGFSFKKELSQFPGVKFPEGTIVQSLRNARGIYSLEKVPADSVLYTYKAFVVKVIDGDTLKVDFRLGFGDRKGETIRLNHIDCPEISTPEGKAAKRFVEAQLSGCDFITVKSVKTRKEKWGRYLGDVFLPKTRSQKQQKSDLSPLTSGFIYLNQLLIDKGYAVKVRN
jgi:endonuclease YncB( thermonuclease family)